MSNLLLLNKNVGLLFGKRFLMECRIQINSFFKALLWIHAYINWPTGFTEILGWQKDGFTERQVLPTDGCYRRRVLPLDGF